METVTVGITGASGSVLAKKLIKQLSALKITLHVVATGHGERVFHYETGERLDGFIASVSGCAARVVRHDNSNLFAPISSGSHGVDAMAVVPCSMSSAGKIANGCPDNLLTRAADVCLKERARLVLVPRESPMHAVHLRNLATLSELGAVIAPPVPAFYSNHGTIDEMLDGIVGKTLNLMGIPNDLYERWGGYN